MPRRAGMILRSAALLALSLLVTLGAVMVTISRPAPDLHDSKNVQLTHDAATDFDPFFSPDGKRIAFSSNRSGSFDIWAMDADGKRRMQLTSMSSDERSPKWSPDGKRIAFFAIEHGRTDISVLTVDEEERIDATDDGASKKSFEWNPSGEMIVYDSKSGGRWDIWLADLRGHRSIRLTRNDGDNMDPSWTSDGRGILFCSNRSGVFKIYVLSLDVLRLRQITSGIGNDIKPRTSPDGMHVAFVSDRLGRTTLWIMNADGTNQHEARSSPPIQNPGLSWAPELATDSYPLWNPKSQGVMYSAKGARSFVRETNYDIVPVAGSDSHVFVFYQNISVVGYYPFFDPLFTSDPLLLGSSSYQVYYAGQGDSLVVVTSLEAYSDEVFASWKPDGTAIVYASNRDGTFDIWMQLLGSEAPSPYG